MLAHERGEAAPPEAHVPARRPRRVRERGGALVELFERRSTVDLFWLWLGTVGSCAVPRRYAANLREWMDAIQTVARELA